jgi:hypothetical protein
MTLELDKKAPAAVDRRQVLKSIGLLLGCTLSPSTIAGALAAAAAPAETWKPRLLSPQQDQLVTTLAELILPATDTPGAKAARVNQFIDLMLAEWMTPDEREPFLAGLADIDARAHKSCGAAFVSCSEEQQTELLTALAAAMPTTEETKPKPFFRHLKELTLVGYYTSEIGASEELNYAIVFDEYEGCVPLEEIGPAWS